MALTSARALPPTPLETWNWEYGWGERMALLTGLVVVVVVGRANVEVRRERRSAAWRRILGRSEIFEAVKEYVERVGMPPPVRVEAVGGRCLSFGWRLHHQFHGSGLGHWRSYRRSQAWDDMSAPHALKVSLPSYMYASILRREM